MAKKVSEIISPILRDSSKVWICAARQFKRLEELNRPLIEKEAASRDRVEDRPIQLDGFDIFLMGVAIENLLKGVLKAKGWSFEEVVKMDHHLVSLYETCCKPYVCRLTVNDDEREALKKLERFVIWAGKYNLPKDNLEKEIDTWGLLVIHSRYGPIITLEVSESERESIYAVYERFLRYYNGLPPE